MNHNHSYEEEKIKKQQDITNTKDGFESFLNNNK
jgi:hypothetical protein